MKPLLSALLPNAPYRRSHQSIAPGQRLVVRGGVEPSTDVPLFQPKPGHLALSLTIASRAADLPERQLDVAERRPARPSVGSRHWLPRATCLATRRACQIPASTSGSRAERLSTQTGGLAQ
jgi:hypothetical protein